MLYQFPGRISVGRLERRYNRFLADVLLEDGALVTAHNPNTGSMKGLIEKGRPVIVSHMPSPSRKLAYTLQAIQVEGVWVGCNTHVPNLLVEKLLLSKDWPEVEEDKSFSLRREVVYGVDRRSRIDFLLEWGSRRRYIEVKNVTMKVGRAACFPDSVTERGLKHLRELTEMVQQGHEAQLVLVVQRTDCHFFRPAQEIDSEYADGMKTAQLAGVKMLCLTMKVAPEGIRLEGVLPIRLEQEFPRDEQ